jgi:hypothetical protein
VRSGFPQLSFPSLLYFSAPRAAWIEADLANWIAGPLGASVASASVQPPPSCPVPGAESSRAPTPPDEDDGIHVASVTRVEHPDGPVLRVVVAWIEEGRWTERSVELPEERGPGAGATSARPSA